MKSSREPDPDPAGVLPSSQRKHLEISGSLKQSGFGLRICKDPICEDFDLFYPDEIWENFPEGNKKQLLDNLAFSFTAHLPLLKGEDLDLKYDTSQPMVSSWIYNLFLRFLPTYRHLYEERAEGELLYVLRRMLTSDISFAENEDMGGLDFFETDERNVIVPFTFGKDSLLTYCVAKEIGLRPIPVCFYEPTEKYSKRHKLELIENFEKDFGEKIYFVDNGFANLRAGDDGWFGWESTLTTYALMSLPFAYSNGARYIIFSNEISCNDYFYDDRALKVMFDYEQSDLATGDLSALIRALTNGKVGCANFLQGLYEIAIIGILKNNFGKYLKYLMSCWADNSGATKCRWCQECSKCGRIFLFLAANGIDPQEQAGFSDNLFEEKYLSLFNIFSNYSGGSISGSTKGVTYDSIGINRDEQLLAFYLAYRRGFKGYAIDEFAKSKLVKEAEVRFVELIDKYYGFKESGMIPKFCRDDVNNLFKNSLSRSLSAIRAL